jgi:uncharacterized protein YjaZ
MEVTLAQLTDDQRLLMIMLFARGYTVRRIQLVLAQEHVEMSAQELLLGAVQYAPDVEQVQRQLAESAFKRGLAKKDERVRRLSELAEKWEDKAGVEAKAAGVYLRTLDQLKEETVGIGQTVPLDEDDPWAKLLKQLRKSEPQVPKSIDGSALLAPTSPPSEIS